MPKLIFTVAEKLQFKKIAEEEGVEFTSKQFKYWAEHIMPSRDYVYEFKRSIKDHKLKLKQKRWDKI